MSQAQIAIRLILSGKVQGVGFRDWVVRTAPHHHLNGWVRNLRDGRVEALFSGTTADLEAMVKACAEGPPEARVEQVERYDYTGSIPSGFYRVADA